MTNFERIKQMIVQMSVEEMACFIDKARDRELCAYCAYDERLCGLDENCIEGHLKWMNKETEAIDFLKKGDTNVTLD